MSRSSPPNPTLTTHTRAYTHTAHTYLLAGISILATLPTSSLMRLSRRSCSTQAAQFLRLSRLTAAAAHFVVGKAVEPVATKKTQED